MVDGHLTVSSLGLLGIKQLNILVHVFGGLCTVY